MLIPTKHTDALGSETEVTKTGAQKWYFSRWYIKTELLAIVTKSDQTCGLTSDN